MDSVVSPFAGLLPETCEIAGLLSSSACAADPLLRDSQALRTTLSVCLHAQVPMLLVWGDQSRCIYNDACIALLGARHPAAFGQPLAELADTAEADHHGAHPHAALPLSAWSCSPILQAGERLGMLYVAGTLAPAATQTRSEAEPAAVSTALNQSPAFMAVLRGPGYIVESANQRFHDLVGHRPLLGQPLLEAMPELADQGYVELLDEVRRSGRPFIGESMAAYLQRRPGSVLDQTFVDFLYQPMRERDGRIDAILVHGFDVTEQRNVASRDSFLLMLEDALQNVSDPRQIIDTSVRLLGEHLQVNRCAFGLAAADGRTMHVISDHVQDMPSLQGDFPLEVAQGLRDALLENRPWFTTDAMAPGAPDYVAQQYRRSGLRASLAIPLHKHGRLVAAIGVHQRAPRRWLSTEIELVRLVAARCWESMQRAKAQQQLAANEAGCADWPTRCRRSSSSPTGRVSRITSIGAGTNTPDWILQTTRPLHGIGRIPPMACGCLRRPGRWQSMASAPMKWSANCNATMARGAGTWRAPCPCAATTAASASGSAPTPTSMTVVRSSNSCAKAKCASAPCARRCRQ